MAQVLFVSRNNSDPYNLWSPTAPSSCPASRRKRGRSRPHDHKRRRTVLRQQLGDVLYDNFLKESAPSERA